MFHVLIEAIDTSAAYWQQACAHPSCSTFVWDHRFVNSLVFSTRIRRVIHFLVLAVASVTAVTLTSRMPYDTSPVYESVCIVVTYDIQQYSSFRVGYLTFFLFFFLAFHVWYKMWYIS